MGVEYSYYNSQKQTYFDMGKWYCWDKGWKSETSAVDKLMLPQDELLEEIFAYIEHFDMLVSERRKYAEWLSQRLVDFRGDSPKEAFSWVNDCDDSDIMLSTCLVCHREYLCKGDKCHCPNPTLPKLVGTRYMGDDGQMLHMNDEP